MFTIFIDTKQKLIEEKYSTGGLHTNWMRLQRRLAGYREHTYEFLVLLFKEPVKSFPGMFRKMKISLYDN